jgi:uncharacterized coiled-coil DUF342 family protein
MNGRIPAENEWEVVRSRVTARTRRFGVRKVFTVLVFVMVLGGVLYAQSGTSAQDVLAGVTSIRDLDLDDASIHMAGPEAFYVRGVGIDGRMYSLTFSQDSNGIWALSNLVSEDLNVLPARTVLDFASLTAVGEDQLRIDGVFVDGEVYAGSLTIGDDAGLELAGAVESGSVDAVNEARALALAELAVAETSARFEAELAEQQAELDAVMAQIELLAAERDSLAEQLETLSGADTYTSLATPVTVTVEEGSPVSAEQVDALFQERDLLAGQLVGLLAENNTLRDDTQTLSEQIAELRSQNEELLDELAGMTAEVARLTELVAAYRSAEGAGPAGDSPATDAPVSDTPETVEATDPGAEGAASEAPSWTIPGDYLRKSDLEEVAEAVTRELVSLEERVARLEAAAIELADLEEALRTGVASGLPGDVGVTDVPGTLPGSGTTEPTAVTVKTDPEALEAAQAEIDAARAETQDLTDELEALVALNEELRAEARGLETRILNDILSNGLVAMMEEQLTRTVREGLAESTPDVGEWYLVGNRAIQSDSDAFFARLAVPAAQSDEPVLYSFRVRTLDPEGWVGVGLHFYTDDVELRRAYGMGRGFLVWLTRDPDVYRNQLTYLQLYRSDDDINMGRVMDAVIEEPINEFVDVDVLFEPETGYVTVAIDGEDKVRYRTWFGIDSGVEVALRSLGAAEFADFRIRTTTVR